MMIQEGYMVDVSSHLGFIIPLFGAQVENSESIPGDMLTCDQYATKGRMRPIFLGSVPATEISDSCSHPGSTQSCQIECTIIQHTIT